MDVILRKLLGLVSLVVISISIGQQSFHAGASPVQAGEPLVCEYYDYDGCGAHNGPSQCNKTEVCPPPEEGKRAHCYALWDNTSVVRMKGCWLDHQPCYDKPTCTVLNIVDKGRLFCCCEGHMCNTNLVQPSHPLTMPPPSGVPMFTVIPARTNTVLFTFLISIAPLIGISIIVLVVVFIWRSYTLNYARRMPSHEPQLLPHTPPPSPCITRQLVVQKVEMKARGRFGSVWKGQIIGGEQIHAGVVAIKVFPLQDRASWCAEQDFYTIVHGSLHANVLRFIAAEKRSIAGATELWLITEYHERGSLYDYLKGSTVSLYDVLRIAATMFRGLSYLHAVVPACGEMREKPAVAHRDIKSRNVLLKSDMTACIADFGLAIGLGHGIGDVHNQVGTRRYMSPEVLDGSINFSIDNFLKIDIYASALVLWELLSRCSLSKVPVGEYRMPFEAEVGSHPSLESMQDLVVNKKFRPQLLQHWLQHKVLGQLCSTIEECWDQDPEARLSSECVEARLNLLLNHQLMPSTTSSLFVSVSQLFFDIDAAPAASTAADESTAVV